MKPAVSPPAHAGFARLKWLGLALVLVGIGVVCVVVGPRLWNHNAVPDQDTNQVPSSPKPTRDVAISDAVLPVEPQTSWNEVDDPARDGWSIEVQAEQAKQMLYEFGKLVLGNAAFDGVAAGRLADADYSGHALLPARPTRMYDDQLFLIDRWSPEEDSTTSDQVTQYQGVDGFVAAARELARGWSAFDSKRFEFKVVSATDRQGTLETRQYVAISGIQPGGSIQEQHAIWIVRWTVQANTEALRFRSIQLTDFEQTTCVSGHKLFADCTASILNNNDCYQSQLLYGMNYWLERTQDMRYFAPLGNPGLAVADVNGDGLDDLYICQEANLPNRLFLQQADGSAREASAEWHVDFLEGSRSALLVDLDNDGDQDLVVAIMGGLVIASHEGDHFAVRDVLETFDDTTSLTAADFDADGDLDLHVCVDYPNDYFASSDESAAGMTIQGGAANRVYHDANNAGRNSLFRNDISGEQWRFVDVTVETGMDENNRRFSWAACWEDYDNDGDQDLYVANDFGRNNLYANDGGRFSDIAARANVEDSAAGMSAAWSDFNRDGYMDVYVANMFSSAGSRITDQPSFKRGSTPEMRARWRQFALGNTLFTNLGKSGFRDVSADAAVTLGRWSWSSNFVDINNDGWPDIAVANGYITADDTSDL